MLLLMLFLLVINTSCTEVYKTNSDNNRTITKCKEIGKDTLLMQETGICPILKNIDSTTSKILHKDVRLVLNHRIDDNCKLNYLDSISKRLMSRPEEVYFTAIISIHQVSDGYLSEYLSMIAYDQFSKNYEVFHTYYKKEKKDRTAIKNLMFDGVLGHIQVANDPKQAKKKILEQCNLYKSLYDEDELLDELIKLVKSQ